MNAATKVTNPVAAKSEGKGELYSTSDQLMIEALLMQGFKPDKIEPGQDNQLFYHFPMTKVWDTVQRILTGQGDEMTFTYSQWWTARTTWQMNLRHYTNYRCRDR